MTLSDGTAVGPVVSSQLLDSLPEYAATEEILRSESFQIQSGDGSIIREYELDVTPYTALDRVEVRVGNVPAELDRGDGVDELIVDGEKRGIVFDDDIELRAGDTAMVYYLTDPILKRYVGSYEDDLNGVRKMARDIRGSRFIEHADGTALDFIGSWFGDVGARRGRPDDDYRAFLSSIVRAFNGTGTRHDMRLVISGAVRGEIEDIQIDEDFEQTGFRITIIEGEDAEISAAINDVVRMARPSGVELLDDPIVISEGATAEVTMPGAEVVRTGAGLGSDEIGEAEIGGLTWEDDADPPSP